MVRFKIVATLITLLSLSAVAHALPGAAPVETAIAEYDFSTGQIVVSYNGVVQWSVQSASSGLTGDAPVGLPVFGGLISDFDSIIGEASFSTHTDTDLNLGNVAATGLPQGDLTIHWSCGLGDACGPPTSTIGPVVYINVPEPTTLTLAAFSLFGLCCRRRNRA